MAGALYQDWENYNPNNPTALRPPSYWYAVKENLPHALRGFQRMPTNVMGFPVDMVNLAVGAKKPFLGSEYLAEKLNVPERTGHPTELGTEIASEFLLPTAQGLGRSALKAEEFLGRTLKEKLPEVVGKHVPEPFRTPITGLSIKPKDSALSPSLTKEVVSGDKYFRPESLESFNFINPASRETLTYMSPDEFLTLAEKGTDKGKTKKVSELIKSDTKFENLPSIHFTHDGKGMAQVVGHEGRHRMRALKELGVTKVPVRLGSEGKKSIRWGNADEVDHLDYIPPKARPTQIKSEDGDAVLPMFDSDAFPIYSPMQRVMEKNVMRGPWKDSPTLKDKQRISKDAAPPGNAILYTDESGKPVTLDEFRARIQDHQPTVKEGPWDDSLGLKDKQRLGKGAHTDELWDRKYNIAKEDINAWTSRFEGNIGDDIKNKVSSTIAERVNLDNHFDIRDSYIKNNSKLTALDRQIDIAKNKGADTKILENNRNKLRGDIWEQEVDIISREKASGRINLTDVFRIP